MSGRRVLLICFGFVAVLGGLGGWWMVSERPRTGPYLDVLALDGEYAVAIRHERTHDRAYVELFGTHEGLRWQALVPRYRVPDGALGVAASAHAVTVRFPRDGRTQIFGFATATAQKLGTVSLGLDLAKEPDGQTPAELATLPADDQSFEFIQPDDGPTRVYQLTVLQGRIGWERDLPAAGVGSAWITRDRLVVEQPASTTSIDRATGVAWTLDASRSCTVDAADGAPGVVLLAQPGALVVVGLDDGAATERIALRDGDEFAGLCGRRGDRLVALMEYQGAPELWLWRTGERPTAIPLGSGSVIGFDATPATRVGAPGSLPLAGALDPVVPILVRDRMRDDGAAHLVAVDLDRGAIAWTSTPRAAMIGATLVRSRDTVLIRAGDDLVALDPATRATRAIAVPGTRPLRPHHVAHGAVWLVGDDGLTSLDAATLEVRGRFRKGPVPSQDGDAISRLGLGTSP